MFENDEWENVTNWYLRVSLNFMALSTAWLINYIDRGLRWFESCLPRAQRAMYVCACLWTIVVSQHLAIGSRLRMWHRKSCGVTAPISHFSFDRTNISHSCRKPKRVLLQNLEHLSNDEKKFYNWVHSILMNALWTDCDSPVVIPSITNFYWSVMYSLLSFRSGDIHKARKVNFSY